MPETNINQLAKKDIAMTSYNFSVFVATLTSKYSTAMDRAMSAVVDYFALTALREPNAKGNMPWDAEIHYFLNNQLNGLWQAMYGNTTDTVGLDMDPAAMPRDLAWKPVHALCRANAALDAYKGRRTYCDETAENFDPEAAANDPTFLRLAAEQERVQALFDFFKEEFDAKRELFEGLFDEAWTYKPYKVGVKGESTSGELTEAQKAAAAKYRAMQNRRTGEAPQTEAA